MSDQPLISVVVPTCDRSDRLPRLVRALEEQIDAPPFEIIVVDDASTDDTWAVLERLTASSTIELKPVRMDVNGGPARARNAGWRAARGEAIAFTDDDCVPEPSWLSALAKQLRTSDLVQGRTVSDPAQQHLRSWFSHTIEVDDERGFYETCNIAYRRDVLEELDGFSEHFPHREHGGAPMWGEDVDLAWRALESGARSTFEPTAIVRHDVEVLGLAGRLSATRRQETMPLIVKRHPDLRARFAHPLFLHPAHPRALALVAGVGLVAPRPGSVLRWAICGLLALPWVKYRGSKLTRSKWRLLPPLLLVDLAEVAMLARGSLRYRTFLL